ncbi:MAG TPA: tetratricopeptide repeat protein [Chthoniobacterales bacterium]|nr:tetratricopeptide repeat protein [Chthoniobacterales bacterium]
MNFFSELKRRNVYKVAITYAVVAWLLVQIGSILFPTFEVPAWVMKVYVTAIAAGFLVALVLAWAFELTPHGIKRTELADAAPERPPRRGWIPVVVIAAGLSVGLFLLGRYTANHAVPRQYASPTRSEVATQKSVAVLPFESLSEDRSNAYFATGIQDEILTRLAKLGELKVISRTSTAQYQSKPGNPGEIAKQLGVAHLLEGSVQKVGEQVRVNVQLINAQNDAHVWANTYDRKLIDVFAVETEIAESIAKELQAKLSGHDREVLALKPTNNPEAYDAYLRGLAAESESLVTVYPLQKAISFYKRAVHLDPSFAIAWARLSQMYSLLYGSFGDRLGDARGALEHAQALQPSAPETLLALAYYQNHELREYEHARETFLRVAKLLPGNSQVPASLANIARREGQWDKVTDYSEQALVLDPRNPDLLLQAAFNYGDQRQFETARSLLDRALQVRPDDVELKATKAMMYQGEDKLTEADKYLAEVNAFTPSYEAVGAKVAQLRLERKNDEAVQLLKTRASQFQFGSEVEEAVFGYFLAFAQHVAGDTAAAQATAAQTRDRLVRLTREQPDNDWLAVVLSQTYAILGDKGAAWKEAERVKTITSSLGDVAVGPFAEENVAVVATLSGDHGRAIESLSHLAQISYSGWLYGIPVTPAALRLDPIWDPLRSDPAFQKLCRDNAR